MDFKCKDSVEGINKSEEATTLLPVEEMKSPLSINEKKEPETGRDERRSAGMIGSIFNMANTGKKILINFSVIGAGVLAFPFTYMDSGLVFGIILTITVVVLSGLSMHIIVYCGMVDDNAQSYQDVIRIYLGQFALTVSEILFILNLIGVLIIFLVIIGDSIVPVVVHYAGNETFLSGRVFIICAMGCLVCFPLTLLKEVKKLSFSSFIALGGVLYLLVMIIVLSTIDFASGEPLGNNAVELIAFNHGTYLGIPKTIISIPIIAIAFQGIEIIAIPIYYELKNPSLWKMDIIIFSALAISSSIYIVVGIFGFLTFGDTVNSNILLSYGGDSIPALVARFLIGLTVTLSYPLIFFAMRLAVHSFVMSFQEVVVDKYINKSTVSGTQNIEKEKEEKRRKREKISSTEFLFVTVFGNCISIGIAVFMPNITDIFGIVGSFGAVTFVFIYPLLLCVAIVLKSKYNLCIKIFLICLIGLCVLASLGILVLGETVTILKMIVESTTKNEVEL